VTSPLTAADIIGDQLTGVSSANAYRRVLLQGCRQCEIDCWNGKKNTSPIVTHGHTFCTTEAFDEVAKAVAECAFVASELPVVLSMEMHCSSTQQNSLAKMLVQRVGDALLSYDQFVSMCARTTVTCVDLEKRILTKGKVKNPERKSTLRREYCVKLTAKISSRYLKAVPSSNRQSGWSTSRSTSHSRWSLTDRLSNVTTQRSESDSDRSTPAETEDAAMAAMRMMEERRMRSSRNETDAFYAEWLCLRSMPAKTLLASDSNPTTLPITSMNEGLLLKVMGLTAEQRDRIEGLQVRHTSLQARRASRRASSSSYDIAEVFGLEKMSSRAIVRLAASPPAAVGSMQRRTAKVLVRPFPNGTRFSGANMSPLPAWLSGCQSVCLNMSYSDLAVQLHFALFNGSGGFVLKPAEMCAATQRTEDSTRSEKAEAEDFWPPAREWLHRTTITLMSLHNLPKRGERRPRYDGRRAACHGYHSELSGTSAPPNRSDASSPALHLSLHPIGGFCGISRTLPVPPNVETESTTATVQNNGMNAVFDESVHCVAAEPLAVFFRFTVSDRDHEVAYSTGVLGRLRSGYRVLLLRSSLGTRIELAYVVIKISTGREQNAWIPRRQLLALLKSSVGQAMTETKRGGSSEILTIPD